MIDVNDDDEDDLLDDIDPRDARAVEVYERLEEELTPDDDSGHQRYSKRDASTTEAGPIVDQSS